MSDTAKKTRPVWDLKKLSSEQIAQIADDPPDYVPGRLLNALWKASQDVCIRKDLDIFRLKITMIPVSVIWFLIGMLTTVTLYRIWS
jgi:hypothetical protein